MLGRFFDRLLRRQDFRVDGEPVARMVKWTLISNRLFSIFLHKFNGPDWTQDPHDHPTDFLSIGLLGSYVETVYDSEGRELYQRAWRAPWMRTFPATHIHRTSAVGKKGAFTMCVASRWKHDWGFVIEGKLTPWRDYLRFYRSRRADRVLR
jgi:hypothetical protein